RERHDGRMQSSEGPEVISSGPERPPGTGRRVWVAVAVCCLAVGGVLTARSVTAPEDRAPSSAPTPSASGVPGSQSPVPGRAGSVEPGPDAEVGQAGTPALVFTGAASRAALDRLDPTAAQGSWSVVLRRPDGSLGHHSLVLTYPV